MLLAVVDIIIADHAACRMRTLAEGFDERNSSDCISLLD